MTLVEKIMDLYPSLTQDDFIPPHGSIRITNAGFGAYIEIWEHPSLPKPTDEQLKGV